MKKISALIMQKISQFSRLIKVKDLMGSLQDKISTADIKKLCLSITAASASSLLLSIITCIMLACCDNHEQYDEYITNPDGILTESQIETLLKRKTPERIFREELFGIGFGLRIDPAGLQFLLDEGLDVNTKNQQYTPLRVAAYWNDADMIRDLLEAGAGDKNGALKTAVRYRQFEAVKELVKNGADTKDALNAFGIYMDYDIVKYLVENGADVKNHGGDALWTAAGNGYSDIVKYLVENGADVKNHGRDALWRAAIKGHSDIVKYLVENGAHIDDGVIRDAATDEIRQYLRSKQ